MAMEKKLSQAEIDELVRQMVEGAQLREEKVAVPTEGKRIERYDFRGSQRLSRDQIRTLARVNKMFTRTVSTLLAHRVRDNVSVDASMVQQMTYPEFTRLIPNPTLLAIYDVQPINLKVILQIDLRMVFLIYDRLCGGPGTIPSVIRELSDVETAVIRRHLLETLGGALAQGWEGVRELQFTLSQIESNPFYLNVNLEQDQLVLVTFETKIGQFIETFNVCIPYEMVEFLIPKSPHRSRVYYQRKPSEQEMQRLQARLQNTSVKLDAQLGRTTLTVAQLLDLRVGDVIAFDQLVKEPLTIRIAGLPKFQGIPGTAGRRLAVRITGALREESEE